MPPSSRQGWINASDLILPRQTLSKEEADDFLSYVFRYVARRPARLRLRETAAVARYLKAIVVGMPGSWERDELNRLSEVIWLTMLDVGEIKIASKTQVIRFLERHADTYLASLAARHFIDLIEKRARPLRHREYFQPPKLASRGRSVRGDGPRQLQDDLTERIYVAYHALRRARVGSARGRVARVLNDFGLRTKARGAVDRKWGSQEVIARVQQCDDRIVRQHQLNQLDTTERRNERERLKAMLVDGWIYAFVLSAEPSRGNQTKTRKMTGGGVN